jgi:hypothetical protein
VGATGVGEEDGDDEGAVAGSWKLDSGSWILVTGFRFHVSGVRFLVTGLLFPVSVRKMIATGFFWQRS